MKMKANKTSNELKVSDSNTYRLKTKERTKNDEERLNIFAKSPTETSRKRYGSASAWIFFTEKIFLTNFKWFSDTSRVEHFCSSLLPLFIEKGRRCLPPSSPRQARLLPPEGIAFWGTSRKAQVGLVAICTPCLLNTPPCTVRLIAPV